MLTDEQKKLVNELKEGISYNDLEEEYDLSYDQAKRRLDSLREKGVDISERRLDNGRKMFLIESKDSNYSLKEKDNYRIGVVSDTHLGSVAEQLNALYEAYDECEDYDVDFNLHAGDISDGCDVYRGHRKHKVPEAIGWGRLIDYVVDNYPEKDFKTLHISGNHDDKFFQQTGIHLGDRISQERDDIEFLGEDYTNLDLGKIDIDMVHPSGGTPYCYTGDTRVLTKEHGFVRFDEIPILISEVGDIEVATFNLDIEEMEFQKPEKFVMMDADEMYHFTGQGIDQFVTKNHRMIVRKNGDYHSKEGDWEIKRANEIVENFKRQKYDVPRTAGWNTDNELKTFELEAQHPNGKDFKADGDKFLEFLGWYISEGFVKSTNKGRIYISQVDNQEEVVECVKSVGLNGNIYQDKIKSTNKVLAEWLRENVGKGAKNKRIPVKIKQLSKRQLNILLEAMFKGDGSHDKEGKKTHYTTASKELAHDVVELLIKIGKAACLRRRDREYRINGYEGQTTVYEICVGHTKKSKAPSICQEPEEISDFDDKVYCLSVPNTTILTMRNGKTVFSGQTLGYRGQTWLRNKTDSEKADLTIFGHLHQMLNGKAEGSEILYAGAFQGQTPYLDRKGINTEAGFHILDIDVDEGGIKHMNIDRYDYDIEKVSESDIDEVLDY